MENDTKYIEVRISSETKTQLELDKAIRSWGYYAYTAIYEKSYFSEKWVPVFVVAVERNNDLLSISGMRKIIQLREKKETYYWY